MARLDRRSASRAFGWCACSGRSQAGVWLVDGSGGDLRAGGVCGPASIRSCCESWSTRSEGPQVIPQGVQVFVALDTVDLRAARSTGSQGSPRSRSATRRAAARSSSSWPQAKRAQGSVLRRQRDVHLLQEARPRASSPPARAPAADGARHVEVDDATLDALLDGIDVDAAPRAPTRRPRLH